MYQIKTLNNISPACKGILTPDRYVIGDEVERPDGIFVRATDIHKYPFNPELLCIARAGIGVNSIPLDRCSESGIAVFNSPGANANGVKELFVFALSMASRDIMGSLRWVYGYGDQSVPIQVAMEKIKKQFAGPEYWGKTLGVVGMGNVGGMAANVAVELGMNVVGYDPYLSVDAAWKISREVHRVDDLDTLLRACDYLTLHVPLNDETRGMIGAEAIAKMKPGVRIINYARGEVVDEPAILAALHSGQVARFVTDFPTAANVLEPQVVATPHLGGTTIESEENCAVMAAQEMKDYLENGNINHSVNLPDASMPWSGVARLCVINRNSPGMLSAITAVLSQEGVNVENLTNKSRGEYAYTLVDIGQHVTEQELAAIRAIQGVLRVRYLTR